MSQNLKLERVQEIERENKGGREELRAKKVG